jgi:hypothetical protein
MPPGAAHSAGQIFEAGTSSTNPLQSTIYYKILILARPILIFATVSAAGAAQSDALSSDCDEI